MKPVQLLVLLLAAGCAQAAPSNNQGTGPVATPPNTEEQARIELMDQIERQVRMPPGAGALSTYSRSYAWHYENGVRTVQAVYERLTNTGFTGRRWVEERDFPLIADGGCGVVSLSYDLAAQRITHIACNGDA